jgi:hypothetical protein
VITGSDPFARDTFPELVSLFSRFKSVRKSAAE